MLFRCSDPEKVGCMYHDKVPNKKYVCYVDAGSSAGSPTLFTAESGGRGHVSPFKSLEYADGLHGEYIVDGECHGVTLLVIV